MLRLLRPRRTRPVRIRQSRPARVAETLETRRLLTTISSNIDVDTEWTVDQSPYEVTRDVFVTPDTTLTIQPGVEVLFRTDARIEVHGRMVAEGRPDVRIQFGPVPGGGRWDGLKFENTREDNRVTYADMDYGDAQGEAIEVDHSRLFLDHITWSRMQRTILELEHPSLIVRNSVFPPSGGEVIHGEFLSGDEYLIIQGNTFANSNNGSDVLDFLGADRPGPVLQILDNVFLGGGDDGLDLDGTDAHIEGNLFMNFRKNTGRATTSNAIATGEPQTGGEQRTDITVVRNIFVNNDHALLLKEEAFATLEHNLFIDTRIAAIQFNEVGGTAVLGAGKGADLRGNIFWNNQSLFKNLIDEPGFRTQLTVAQSLLPNEQVNFDGTTVLAHDLGEGNISGDPRFVDAAALDFRLSDDSPARAQLESGLDLGPYVPSGPHVTASIVDATTRLQVGGPGITHYRYQIDDGQLSPLTPVAQPIVLDPPLATSDVAVYGLNSAGEWWTDSSTAAFGRSLQMIAPPAVRTGETIPMVARVVDWQQDVVTTFSDLVPLSTVNELSDNVLRVQHGVAAHQTMIAATDDFQLPGAESQTIRILDTDTPIENVSGALTGDVTWDASREYHVTSDLIIPQGARLTLSPATRVLVGSGVNLTVNGSLRSLGTADAPVLVSAIDQPWGGLEFVDADPGNELRYTFLTQGGADASKTLGHSNSQPVIAAFSSSVTCDNCFLINNPGKAFGTVNSRIDISNSVIANVDTGGEFISSRAQIDNTWIMSIPDNGREFVDDDNDGFYFSGADPSGQPSSVRDSFVIHTKDDGIDHNGARLIIDGVWVEGAAHEGLAMSNRNWATVHDSVFVGSNQGIEAGYGGPEVSVTHSVVVGNQNTTDPNSPITAGLRFGDGYDGSNGRYTGQITASQLVLHDNGDNVRNFDGSIGGPQPGAIEISDSLANDSDATDPSNRSGIPVFGAAMHLLRGSAGHASGPEQMPLGRVIPTVVWTPNSADFNRDGVLDVRDIDLLCAQLRSPAPDLAFDLTGDGQVDGDDRDELVLNRLDTQIGDADLDGLFNADDLIEIFAAGEYNDQAEGNSTWADGDWNCDGDFDADDLLLAFQLGGYTDGLARQSKRTTAARPLASPDTRAAAAQDNAEKDRIRHGRSS